MSAAFDGLILFAISYATYYLLKQTLFDPDLIFKPLYEGGFKKEDLTFNSRMTFIVILSFIYALIFSFLMNLSKSLNKYFYIKAIESDELEMTLYDSVTNNQNIFIILDTKKVYMGMVWGTYEPTKERKRFAINPWMSGFVDDEGTIQWKSRYLNIYKEISAQSDIVNQRLIERQDIPLDELHEMFNRQKLEDYLIENGFISSDDNLPLALLKNEDFNKIISISDIKTIGKFDSTSYAMFNNEEEGG